MRRRFRAEAAGDEISPEQTAAERRARIDAEPKPPKRPVLHVGTHVWFIDSHARWFELEVVSRRRSDCGAQVTFKSVTGWDTEREVEWSYGDLLEFPWDSHLFQRLRPLSARRP